MEPSKTTAMRMLCGLLVPTSRVGKVAGFDIMSQSEQVKTHWVYESKFSLYNNLTAKENILFYSGLYGMSKRNWSKPVRHCLQDWD